LVKICGITREEDAHMLTQYDVWALGFIQVESSPRYVRPDVVNKIIHQLPSRILSVGVFRNQSYREIRQIRDYCEFSLLQLHGVEEPSFCARLGSGVIRALGVGDELDIDQVREYLSVVDYLLFDTAINSISGGTGISFAWNLLKPVEQLNKPFLVAGGLSPDNVEQCLATIHPFAIDVNSGVESSPGIKDSDKVQALLKKIKTA